MVIYRAQAKKLDETARPLLKNNLGVCHHACQDNFYNSLKLGQDLLQHTINVCGTMRPSRGIPMILKRQNCGREDSYLLEERVR
jgi:hypothetical protein